LNDAFYGACLLKAEIPETHIEQDVQVSVIWSSGKSGWIERNVSKVTSESSSPITA
jgi:hypothetical protein